MVAAYYKSGDVTAKNYRKWSRYSTRPYQSATHGGRFVQNYSNDRGKGYAKFESAGKLPVGARLAKDSFQVTGDGKVAVGPLFVMEKMSAGFNPDSGDWKYSMIMPDGMVFGETKGKNSEGMEFCVQCHAAVSEQDHLYFLPIEFRRKR